MTTYGDLSLQKNITYSETEPANPATGDLWANKDTVSFAQVIYDVIHPVGDLIIGFAAPTVPTGVTATWTADTTYNGKSLWIDSTQTPGTSLAGSLPNITGSAWGTLIHITPATSGAFSWDGATSWGIVDGAASAAREGILYINASNSNSVYGASAGANVVRPTSVCVTVYKRTA